MTTEEDEALILDSVREFLKRDVAPYAHDLEARDEYPQEIADKMADLGLFGTTISADYGGLGLSCTTFAKIMEEISSVWMSVGGIIGAHLVMARAVEHFGSEEMKQDYLPKFATGELRGGIALTEPDAGTDLQAIRTRRPVGKRSRILRRRARYEPALHAQGSARSARATSQDSRRHPRRPDGARADGDAERQRPLLPRHQSGRREDRCPGDHQHQFQCPW